MRIFDWLCYRLVLVWPLRYSVKECRFFFEFLLPRAGNWVYRDHDYGERQP